MLQNVRSSYLERYNILQQNLLHCRFISTAKRGQVVQRSHSSNPIQHLGVKISGENMHFPRKSNLGYFLPSTFSVSHFRHYIDNFCGQHFSKFGSQPAPKTVALDLRYPKKHFKGFFLEYCLFDPFCPNEDTKVLYIICKLSDNIAQTIVLKSYNPSEFGRDFIRLILILIVCCKHMYVYCNVCSKDSHRVVSIEGII